MVLRFPEGYWHFLEIFSSLLDEHRKRLSCNISISVSAKPACSFLSAFWLTWPGTLVLQVDLNPYSKSLCLLGAFVSENLFWFCSSCSFDCANLLEPTSCTIRYVPINDINDPLFSFFFFFTWLEKWSPSCCRTTSGDGGTHCPSPAWPHSALVRKFLLGVMGLFCDRFPLSC